MLTVVQSLRIDAELLKIARHLFLHLGQLSFERDDLLLYGSDVDLGFGLEGIDVARDVEIESVLLDLLEGDHARVFLDILARGMSLNDLIDMLSAKTVLGLALDEVATRIDEDNVAPLFQLSTNFAPLVEEQNRDRNTRRLE